MAPTVDDLRQSLAALSLDTRGHKDVLQKRLARANKARATVAVPSSSTEKQVETLNELQANRPEGELYDSFLCFDVEATCERMDNVYGRAAFSYPNEIIEFPVLLLQWTRGDRTLQENEGSSETQAVTRVDWRLEVVDEFHSYVRPTWRPKLSRFCTELTGITQAQVDAAPTYPEMLNKFDRTFIKKHQLFTRANKTVWVCDGPWDIRDFISKASYLSRTRRPNWLAGDFVDLRLLSSSYFGAKARIRNGDDLEDEELNTLSSVDPPTGDAQDELPPPTASPSSSATVHADRGRGSHSETIKATAPTSLSLPAVLLALNLEPFIGRLHSGLDDARNAARILVELQKRDVALLPNRCVPLGKERRFDWMGKHGEVRWDD